MTTTKRLSSSRAQRPRLLIAPWPYSDGPGAHPRQVERWNHSSASSHSQQAGLGAQRAALQRDHKDLLHHFLTSYNQTAGPSNFG
ncbi:MAG: hypothetical protein FJW37_13705 [Acidobacteria bacterium]|nr:hypothetical protein [Acidobacteriota bacterium]